MTTAFAIDLSEPSSYQTVGNLITLRGWCDKNKGAIITSARTNCSMCSNMNLFATLGNGPVPHTEPHGVEYFVFLQNNVIFTEKQLDLMNELTDPFIAGWRSLDLSNNLVAAGNNKNGTMTILKYSDLLELETASPKELIEVDFAEFGFIRVHKSIFEKMKYPYFRQNIYETKDGAELGSEAISFCMDVFAQTGIKVKLVPGIHILEVKSLNIP